MVIQEHKHSLPGSRLPVDNGLPNEDAKAALIAHRRSVIRSHKSDRCTMARRKLNAVFNMRKYYVAVICLTLIEAVFVICHLVLETESLRLPPGNTWTAIRNSQLSLSCLSMPTLLLFLIEQPFKWWALDSRLFCKSVVFVVDALVCMFCFSINIQNIHMDATKPDVELASASQLALCGLTHITHPPKTGRTFAYLSGLIILYRLSCIRGYIHKTIQKNEKDTHRELTELKIVHQETENRLTKLENMARDQSLGRNISHSTGRSSGSHNSHPRLSTRRPTTEGP